VGIFIVALFYVIIILYYINIIFFDMSNATHHFHKRKRIHNNHEKYPHPEPLKRFVDHSIYVVGMIAPLFYIPQIWKIWADQNGESIAISTFAAFFVTNIFWVLYGSLHKEKPIIVIHSSLVICNIIVISGAFLYG
jgi:uncharacterized protein with PQ loop repeat